MYKISYQWYVFIYLFYSKRINDDIFLRLQAKDHHDTIVKLIENISNTDEDLLILKATSLAAINSLEQCFSVLESLNYSNNNYYKK